MKAHIKIPAGWRRLRIGENDRPGDRYFSLYTCEWIEIVVGGARTQCQPLHPYIRRKARKAGK